MREADRTTRERISALLSEEPATPTELAADLELTPDAVVSHVRHVARSLESADGQFLVRPPTCSACGFDGFDDPLNLPSRCPECKCERVEEPAFVVEA